MKNRLRSDDDNFSNESFLKLSHIAAYLIGNYMHHLDHLAPLASLLDIPLIIDDASLVLQAKKYYPHLKIFTLYEQSTIRNALPNLLAVITCHPKKMAQVSLFPLEHLIGHPLQPIWCPHGNSDKGAHSFFMEALADDDYLLVYGNKMIDFLRDKNALSHHAKIIQVGHYRYEYFKNNQLNVQIRLKADAKKQLLNSEKHKYRILYAPTWQPASETHLLIEELNAFKCLSHYDILIKLHPNTLSLSDPHLLSVLYQLEDLPHITFVNDLPIIHPILNSVDLYIGDTSSIGYDFLVFNRPMIFIVHSEKQHLDKGPLYLHRCGYCLHFGQCADLESLIDKALMSTHNDPFYAIRQETYAYTFTPLPSGMRLKDWIGGQLSNIRLHV